MSRKRRVEELESDNETRSTISSDISVPPPAKKYKVVHYQGPGYTVTTRKEIKQSPRDNNKSPLRCVYVIIKEKGDSGQTDYCYQQLPNSYDTEIIGIYADKNKANAKARKYFLDEMEWDDVEAKLEEVNMTFIAGLFCGYQTEMHQGFSKFGGTWTKSKVWVQEQEVL